jgi:predicted TPR repeat methyltransferase
MNDPLALARAHFLEGIAHSEREDWLAARLSFESARQWAPERPSVLLNLGITEIRLGQAAAAVPLLQAAAQAEPAKPDAWLALAWAQYAMGLWQESLASAEKAQALQELPVAALLRQAQCLSRLERIEEAMAAYDLVLMRDPQAHEALTEKGDLYRLQGDTAHARTCYERALALGADAQLLGYFLSALEGNVQSAPKAPLAYVRSLFDQYAEDFEQHLVQQLGYQGHRLLVQQVLAHAAGRFSHALDLGCGTGLCGSLLRSYADRLTGIDLSEAMVAKAAQTGHYDQLQACDATHFLQTSTALYDLVVAADVFIYIGALEPVFAALRPRMALGGWVAFTLEEPQPGQDLSLTADLRYGHSQSYIAQLAIRHGLRVVASETGPLRYDQRQPVRGRYMVLQAP